MGVGKERVYILTAVFLGTRLDYFNASMTFIKFGLLIQFTHLSELGYFCPIKTLIISGKNKLRNII